MSHSKLTFATYADTADKLHNTLRFAQSLRTFGGCFADAPIMLFIPTDVKVCNEPTLGRLRSLDVSLKTSSTPQQAQWFYYAGKVYAAGEAEAMVDGEADILVWLDEDTVVLDEPSDFDLGADFDFGYVPVMHNRSGSLLAQPPDPFWSRIYELLSLTDDVLFPMLTPADKQTIRAYFHVGLIVVRPQKGILRKWVRDFEALYSDRTLADMCRADVNRRIFLHQMALMGVMSIISRENMLPLSRRYNYPIFFEKQYGGVETFDSIEDVITIRCIVSDEKMGRDWHKGLSGPPDRIHWLKENF